MPRKYVRKQNIKPRASWEEADLKTAVAKVKSKEMGVNEASRCYNIPSRTLRRRISLNLVTKVNLGKPPALGEENEMRLVNHIKKLQASGFAPTPQAVRKLAFTFAQKLHIESKFCTQGQSTNSAGMHWFYSFMDRHPELSVRKSEGLSLARAKGMNRDEVDEFFSLLKNTLEKYDLATKPRSIFNMDESGIQINNTPDKVIAQKGSKCVHVLTSKEKGENVSVIACANAEGTFLPPVLILKGVRKNMTVLEGMPTGSDLYMNKKSSFITAELFLKWLQEIFVPRKPDGPVILILDGHSSHCSNFTMLEYAEENNIILLCLPSHTTQALQPLDRSFFKPLKDYFKKESEMFMFANKEKNLNRHAIGKLIGSAWNKAASITNATSGFSACGIYPYNKYIIPDYFFQISDSNSRGRDDQNVPVNTEEPQIDKDIFVYDETFMTLVDGAENCETSDAGRENSDYDLEEEIRLTENLFSINSETSNISNVIIDETENHDLSTQGVEIISEEDNPSTSKTLPKTSELQTKETQPTPSKFLQEIAPLPKIELQKNKRKQSAKILSSLNLSKQNEKKPKDKHVKQKEKKILKEISESTTKTIKKAKRNKTDEDDVKCLECFENYYLTVETVDWIKCIDCLKWLHETCTMYQNRCNDCGRTVKRQEKLQGATRRI